MFQLIFGAWSGHPHILQKKSILLNYYKLYKIFKIGEKYNLCFLLDRSDVGIGSFDNVVDG